MVRHGVRRRYVLCAVLSLGALGAISGCAGPSRSQLKAQAKEIQALQTAHAVHLPPSVDSCVGVTLRLSRGPGRASAERHPQALSAQELENGLKAAGIERCGAAFAEQAEANDAEEAVSLDYAIGVDPAGKVCAIVEWARAPAESDVGELLQEELAACAKASLFRASLPAGRVSGKERIIRLLRIRAGEDGTEDLHLSFE